MKKRIILLYLILFLPSTYALAGVTPAYYEVDFEPGANQEFYFSFINDAASKLEVYAEGPFSEYVSLDKNSLNGGGTVKVYLTFPLSYETPGRHRLLIGALHSQESEALGIVANVQGVIFVNVPYPGKYAELDFNLNNANAGENINSILKISSKGEEEIETSSKILIYDESRNLIEEINLGNNKISSGDFTELKATIKTANYLAGDYFAIADVVYNEKNVSSERIFRLGELFLNITNYTGEFERGKINKFEIEAESYWNDPIDGVYAEASILGYPQLNFLTPSLSIESWSKRKLVGFFDPSEIINNTFEANITLKYEGRTTEEIVNLEIIEIENNSTTYLLYVLVVIILVVAAILIIRRWTKHGKKK